MEEIWKDILGYEAIYQASNLGRIRSFTLKSKGKVLMHWVGKFKRCSVWLRKNNKAKSYLVHRLVLIAFEGYSTDPKKWQVNHKDGNPQNNKLDNLEWNTGGENMKHSYDKLGRKGPASGKKHISSWGSKKIDQFDLQGNYLNTFMSGVYAVEFLNDGTTSQGISLCASGKIKYHNGYIFKYSEK